uniref:NADH dehydrogenase subunit 6 n=1 Tax=Caprella scaura TaxID=703580 RepID=E2RVN0_9CRUS|nr:NADH dehydrogenase subunit 6 [Caprella scaura]BAJ23204.1 NADH dehydrogenase subunit 6 [Caprella scaura]
MLIMIVLLAFVLTNHPLIMGASLMLTSMVMGVTLAQLASTTWIAYMLVMIFVSGMMIIILYMASLSSNEIVPPNTFTKKSYALLIFMSVVVSWGYSKTDNHLIDLSNFYTSPLFKIVYKTYSQLMSPATILIIIYLLVVLITAVSIINVSKVPLRTSGE